MTARPSVGIGRRRSSWRAGAPSTKQERLRTMAQRIRHRAALGALLSAAWMLALCAHALAAATLSPLPPSAYGIAPACAAAAPGHATCLALQLLARTEQARAHTHPLGVPLAPALAAPSPAAGDYGLRPQDFHTAYQLPTTPPAAQTIALVDAYNDPNAEADLKAYDEEFGIPACTTANACFTRVNQKGETANLPFPATSAELEAARAGTAREREEAAEATGWGLEISLDIQAAHATCQTCKILLVEARSTRYQDLEAGVRTASALGANEISNSWGGPEAAVTATLEATSPFNHPGTVITAAAGDSGYLAWDAESAPEKGYAEFPASSPHVVAVGGTRLSLGVGNTWAGETIWNGRGAGGGGCSVAFAAPAWQLSLPNWPAVGCTGGRAVADVAAVADPYTGMAVHYTSPACEHAYEIAKVKHVDHWCTIGGTSLASPVLAAVYALAGGAGGVSYPARTLYENAGKGSAGLHDVLAGSNGECLAPFQPESGLSGCTAGEEAERSCASRAICLAGAGYDGPSGVGTPNGITAFLPTGQVEKGPPEEKQKVAGGGGGEPARASEPVLAAPAPPAPIGTPPAAGIGGPLGGTPGGPRPAQLSGLTLTLRALAALNRGHTRVSQIGFAFTLDQVAQVRVTLARRITRNHRVFWRTLAGPLSIAAASGRNTAHLRGRRRLLRGVYRLTVSPHAGAARSVQFQIG